MSVTAASAVRRSGHRLVLSTAIGIASILAISGLALADAEKVPRVLSYDLDVGFYPDAELDYAGFIGILYGERPPWNKEDSVKAYPHMTGEAVMQVEMGPEPPGSLKIYLHSELRVHGVWIDGNEAELTQKTVFYPRNYSSVATEATVDLGDGPAGAREVKVSYGGMFNASYAASPSNYMRIDEEGAYLRAFGYSLWYPVLLGPEDPSEPASFRRIRVRTPQPFKAVVTGRRVSEERTEGFQVSEWTIEDCDHTALQIAVRPFQEVRREGIHLHYLDHPRSRAAASDILEMVAELSSFFSEHYGSADRLDQAHVVELPNFASGISAGNTIGITSGQWRSFSRSDEDTSLERLVAHEMVHPYVRPGVREKSPLAALFVEGFPSYFHLPALEQMFGEAWYLEYLERVEKDYLKRRETGETSWGSPLPEEKPILEITYDEIGEYKDTFILNDRVRLFLHDLRRRAGSKDFKALTRELMQTADLTPDGFMDLIERFIPGCREDLRIWLETVDYPEHLRL